MRSSSEPFVVRVRKRRTIVGVLVAALVVVPAAIAWACNPQAHVSLDRTAYGPGQTLTVYGSYFPGNRQITVTGPVTTTVTTDAGGSFSTTFTAPSEAGSYVVSATRPTGGSASTSYRVTAPAAAEEPPPQPAPESPAGGEAPNPSFSTPGVERSEREPARTDGGGSERSPAADRERSPAAERTPAGGGSAPGGGVVTVGGQQVFSGSAAPATSSGTFAEPATTGSSRTAGSNRRSSAPSEQAATGDVWSGFAPGRTASLTNGQTGMSDGGAGSNLALGIGLLALGLLALVAGLTAAEVRRRRTA